MDYIQNTKLNAGCNMKTIAKRVVNNDVWNNLTTAPQLTLQQINIHLLGQCVERLINQIKGKRSPSSEPDSPKLLALTALDLADAMTQVVKSLQTVSTRLNQVIKKEEQSNERSIRCEAKLERIIENLSNIAPVLDKMNKTIAAMDNKIETLARASTFSSHSKGVSKKRERSKDKDSNNTTTSSTKTVANVEKKQKKPEKESAN